MNEREKIEWAMRAFEEIARDCEEISCLPIVGKIERDTWIGIADKARRNKMILDQ